MFCYFSADDYSKRLFRSLAVVDHNGSVFWAPPTKFRSTCPVNVMYFPFDDQTCHLKLSSWMYDGYKVSCLTHPSPLSNQENKYWLWLIKNKLIICERIYYLISGETQCWSKKDERIHKLRIVRTNFMDKRKPAKARANGCCCDRWMWPTGRAMLTCRTIYLTESGSCWTPVWAGRRSSIPSVTLLSLTSSSLSSKISPLETRDSQA